jgi:biopolymer transport protein TolR
MRTRTETLEHDGELNTLPYLDVLMNLIIFMLLSMTGLATHGMINATTTGDASGPSTTEQLRVIIDERGFTVRRADRTVELRGRDYAQLTSTLETMKSGELDTRAVVSAAPDTSYEIVVATLDAMRGSAGHRLFPDVALDHR